MERKMFGHRIKRKSSEGMGESIIQGTSKGNPPGYEGKEHVKYKNPGFTRHDIRIPEDEPHMKSHVSPNEEHEMEDNYHMDVPNQTEKNLPAHIKRAKMAMDAINQQDPKPLRGNITHNVPYAGEEDTSGEEQMGPHDMQENEGSERHSDGHKEHRKKMIMAVMKRKMKKKSMDNPGQEAAHPSQGKYGNAGIRNNY